MRAVVICRIPISHQSIHISRKSLIIWDIRYFQDVIAVANHAILKHSFHRRAFFQSENCTDLHQEIAKRDKGIDTLKIQMQEMQERHGKQIRNLQSIHNQELEAKDREISRLNTLLEKAFKWFPMLREMLRMEKLCAVIGFTKDMIDCLLTRKEAIQCNGKIYSEEHRRKFEIKNNIFKVEKNPTDDSKLVLTINRQPISEWFKEQWEKLRQGLRQPTEEPRKSRGFKL